MMSSLKIIPSSSLVTYDSAKRLPRRYAADRRFKLYGKIAISLVLLFLIILGTGIISRALPAFQKIEIGLDISFKSDFLSQNGKCNLAPLMTEAFHKIFIDTQKDHLSSLWYLVSPGTCRILLKQLRRHPQILDRTVLMWIPASDDVNLFLQNKEYKNNLESYRRLKSPQIQALDTLDQAKRLTSTFNWNFFTQGDARNPEFAGIFSALMGSFYLIIVTLTIAVPFGIASAIYLEEFSSNTKLTRFIEANIANLAAVPSIVFGILGMTLFLNFCDIPRSSALVGGLTLGLMTLPIIIVSSRLALKSIPKSIRAAAQALGASHVQVVFHHVFPLSFPGMMTGVIIGIVRAIGETAPLLMIGMMAFVAEYPHSLTDPASTLPVQIFIWARNPEPGFIANAAAGILVLVVILIAMNLGAIFIRRKFETQL